MGNVGALIIAMEAALPPDARTLLAFKDLSEETRRGLLQVAADVSGPKLRTYLETTHANKGMPPPEVLAPEPISSNTDFYLTNLARQIVEAFWAVDHLDRNLALAAASAPNPGIVPPPAKAAPLFYAVSASNPATPYYTLPMRFGNELTAYRGSQSEANAAFPGLLLESAKDAAEAAYTALESAGSGAAERIAAASQAMASGVASLAGGIFRPVLIGAGVVGAVAGLYYLSQRNK